MTRSYAVLEITPASFNEIYEKLLKAGYECLAPDGTLNLEAINLGKETKEPVDATFTRRQLQILDGVLQGQTNKKIAAGYNLSEKTVKAHVTAIFKILGVANRTQALIAYQRWMSSSSSLPESEPASSSSNETSSQAAA